MKREGGRENGYCSKMVSDHGDRCLFSVLCYHRLFFNVFPFPLCKAQLIAIGMKIGAAHRNVRSASFCSARQEVIFICTLYLTSLSIFCVRCAISNGALGLAHRCLPPPIGNVDQAW